MGDNKKRDVDSSLRNANIILWICIPLCFVAPWILTRKAVCESFSFSGTGPIGDTIGGILSPIINLVGAILVFYALKAQITANEIIKGQLDEDRRGKEIDYQTQNLNQLYDYVRESISNFKFKGLEGYMPIYQPKVNADGSLNEEIKVLGDGQFEKGNLREQSGTKAFATLFTQIRCNFHGDEAELINDSSVAEVNSILLIINLLLDTLANSKSNNKDIIKTLLDHQFNYRVISSIKNEKIEYLRIEYCDTCKRNHGIPDNMLTLIETIKQKLKG